MAAYPTTVDSLITSVRRRAFMPADGDGSDTPTTLQLLNESAGWLQAQIEKERQGHYRAVVDVPLVANQQDYSVPIRAAGAQLDIVVPIDSQGNPIDQMLVRDDVEWGAMYPPSQTATYPWRYFWMANSIRVYPPPAAGGYSLRMFYLQRIAQQVLLASCWNLSFIVGGGVFTMNPIFTGLTPPSGDFRPNAVVNRGLSAGWSAGQLVDLVRSTPPFDVVYQDIPIASVQQGLPSLTVAGGTGGTLGTPVFNALGGMTSIPVTAGGSGYTQGTAVLISFQNSGTGFTAFVNVAAGVITSVTVTNPGTGYCDGTQGATGITLTAPVGDPNFSRARVNDYICLTDTAPVLTWTMQEAAPVFAQYCAMKLLEARKDPQAYANSKDALGIEVSTFQSLMAPRMRQQHNKVITGLGQFRWGARRTRPLGGYLR